MTAIADHTTYWDRYAAKTSDRTPQDALEGAFGWTQYPGHGPGAELLGDPVTALELGCGHGDAVAALTLNGVETTGLDLSAAHITSAYETWGHLPRARFQQADAMDYLADTSRHWEAIYSIWGAAWFTDPEQLLPAVHDRLTPGGRLVFSHAPAIPGSYGCQGTYGAGYAGPQVWIYRWAYEPETWTEILHRHGFRRVHARVEPAPEPDHVGTLLVEAVRP
ncbi:trans-aconitate 2-methyltransferase [Planomonospora sp. ID82291]|uniref:class I SAM-dependent methyltransferase n=1 Tax=Planomonospora sp. ID82291 TaxID=2738136 RepID=UPI0018C3D0CA|nr:class I SAM-dependent methyltransferase [Planomonospora sp. ID82291]MBG0818409.1 class I SAM-dependent methyltransferase [Planomonospora sp. ID82291]